jgi:hypothetical protein
MRSAISLLLLCFGLNCHAQLWTSVGGGLDNDVRCFYVDSSSNSLYTGGAFWSTNNKILNGISSWDGQSWDSLGQGTDNCNFTGCNPVVSIAEFNNEIFIGGFFSGTSGIPNTSGIAKWNGTTWESVGGCNGVVWGLIVFNSNLYAAGIFDSIGGIQAYSIARYDGNIWYPVADSIFKNKILGCITVYQNKLFVGGGFHLSSIGANCVAQYDGNTWTSVGNTFQNLMAGINAMTVYQGFLIVGGYFHQTVGDPGNSIAAWDGVSWMDLGGGVSDTLGNSVNVFALTVNGNKLIVAGDFCFAGGIWAKNIAQWDGVNWCSFGSYMTSAITALAFYQDTLYIGGGFWSIDGDTSLHRIARWSGGNYTDTCGNMTSIGEHNQRSVSFYPNPVTRSVVFILPETACMRTIVISDQFGREVWRTETDDRQVEFSVEDFKAGIYFYRIDEQSAQTYCGTFVIQ